MNLLRPSSFDSLSTWSSAPLRMGMLPLNSACGTYDDTYSVPRGGTKGDHSASLGGANDWLGSNPPKVIVVESFLYLPPLSWLLEDE